MARPTLGLSVLATVATVESLHPFRGKGRSINEPKPVGIRDLVAPPGDVKLRPERRWYVIGGFFFLLFLLLVGRLYVLQVKDHKQSVGQVTSNSIRKASIPASRGLILDRNGTPLVNNVTTVEIRLSRAEATLDPVDRGHAGVAHRTQRSARSPATSPTRPTTRTNRRRSWPTRRRTSCSSSSCTRRSSRACRCLNVSQRSYPLGGSVGSQVLGYVGPISENEIKAHPGAGYQTDSTLARPASKPSTRSICAAKTARSTIEVGAKGNVIGTLHTTQPTVGRLGRAQHRRRDCKRRSTGSCKSDILHDRTVPDPRFGILPQAINGAAVVLDVNNGAVLAMSSYPSYNLSSFVNGLSEAEFKHLIPRAPSTTTRSRVSTRPAARSS